MSDRSIWNDAPGLGLASLIGDTRADVVVVGLGGSGLAAVHELLELGVDVVGMDAGEIAAGAAGRNGGFLLGGLYCFYHDAVEQLGRDAALSWYRRTLSEIDRLESQTPQAILRRGSLRIAASSEEMIDCDRQFQAMQRDGLSVERYEGIEGRGLLFPQDAAMHPLRRCRTLASSALRGGARLFEHSPVTALAGSRVATEMGHIECNAVIVAVDGRMDMLLPEMAGRVRTARLQMLATAPTAERIFPRPVYARYGYEYWQQLEGGEIALGGFRDRAGESEWTHSNATSPEIQSWLEEYLHETVGVTAKVEHRWAASVGYTESGMPFFDEVRKGVVAVGGYCGTGNVIGSILGRAAARRVARGERDALLTTCTQLD